MYSTLVGAAEGGLQYLLGGVSKLGGKVSAGIMQKVQSIDSALLRAAATLGTSIASEVTEEELQLFLEPLLRATVFGEEYDAPTVEDMVYTALVTALSTGALEGGNAVRAGRRGGAANGLPGPELLETVAAAQAAARPLPGGETQNAAPGAGTAENINVASPYTEQEAAAIRYEGRTFKNLVAGIDTKVSDFFQKWRGGRKSHQGEKLEKLYLGKLSDASLSQASNILGYEVSERDVIITNDDTKHIADRHPDLDAWVLDSLTDVIADPTSIRPGHEGSGKNFGKTGIIFEKSFPDGTVVSIQFDNPGRGTMQVTTVYTKENATSKAAADTSTAARTPEASEPAFSTDSIPKPAGDVKPVSAENGAGKKKRALEAQREALLNEGWRSVDGKVLPDALAGVYNENGKVSPQLVLEGMREAEAQDAARIWQERALGDEEASGIQILELPEGFSEEDIITDGSHLQRGKLRPNCMYRTGEHGYIYMTNQNGLIVWVRADDLQLKTHDGRLRHDRDTPGKTEGDQAGHLIGDLFGGSPELDNLVTQARSVNNSAYRLIENQWAAAIRSGQSVSVEIKINYKEGSARPASFEVTYTINGKRFSETIAQ